MDAEVFRAWIVSAAGVIEANRDHLTQLDAAIGDADHGINLARFNRLPFGVALYQPQDRAQRSRTGQRINQILSDGVKFGFH